MKTDRELLELAAKAAGYYWDAYGIDGTGNWWTGTDYLDSWNPLTDDGDSFRLAAALLIDIEWETEYIVFANGNFSEDIKDHNNDRAAAIRRVVLRAAAWHGEQLP